MHKADRYNNQTIMIMASKLIWIKKFNDLPKFSSFNISDYIERCLKKKVLEGVYSFCFVESSMQLLMMLM